jgi:hypothetical protein
MKIRVAVWTVLVAVAMAASAFAQTPRVVRFGGVVRDAQGQPQAGAATLALSLYAEAEGGAPLWTEVQAVTLDSQGRYAVALGALAPEGLPLALFASGAARWLGVAVDGGVELPRIALLSVPYALQAADADTLGGRPASDYLLAGAAGTGNPRTDASTAAGGLLAVGVAGAGAPAAPLLPVPLASAGTAGRIGKFINTTDLGDSVMAENVGRIGLGTTAPLDVLHTQFTNTNGQLTGFAVQNLGGTAASYSGMLFYDQNGAVGQFQGFNNATHEYRINNVASNGSINFMVGSSSKFYVANSGNIGIGTAAPTARLHVAGDVVVDGNLAAKYQDVAEWVESVDPLAAGTVVVVDPAAANGVRPSARAYDAGVAGAVSAQPGLTLGERSATKSLVAQSGRVKVKVDARYGAIKAGDLLVTSPTPGHAMVSTPVKMKGVAFHRPGTILGKALEPLASGTGEILVLLTLQ